jgi:hypothetical protein
MTISEAWSNAYILAEVKQRMRDIDAAKMIALKLQEQDDEEFVEDEAFEFEMDEDFFDNDEHIDIPHEEYLPPEPTEDEMNDTMEEWEDEVLDSKPIKSGLDSLSSFSTKRQSYEQTKPCISVLHNRIRIILKNDPGLSRKEISLRAGISLSSACGRINELMKAGEVEKCGTKWDSESDRKVQILRITKQ